MMVAGNLQQQNSTVAAGEPSSDPADHVPPVLQPGQIDLLYQQLCQEFQPQGFVEHFIVKDMARRAASMDLLEDAAGAMQRESASRFLKLGIVSDTLSIADTTLIGAVSAGKLEACERRSLGSARAFFRGLQILQDLQAKRSQASSPRTESFDEKFETEAACEMYLRKHIERRDPLCHRCNKKGVHWLTSRRCWECRHCKHQTGQRIDTVMERSPLPLKIWFAAIRILLLQPTISTAELAKQIDIRRLGTVRLMADKIRAAVATGNASELLVGLDTVFGNIT